MTEDPASSVTSVANGAIAALKNTPALLVLVLLNVAMIGAATYFLSSIAHDVGERQQLILDRCLPGK